MATTKLATCAAPTPTMSATSAHIPKSARASFVSASKYSRAISPVASGMLY